jgi:hypothetical protein
LMDASLLLSSSLARQSRIYRGNQGHETDALAAYGLVFVVSSQS